MALGLETLVTTLGPALLGGLFGSGGDSGPSNQEALYARFNQILDKAVNLYDSTDFEALDRHMVDTYRKSRMQDTETQLKNYDAGLRGLGYGSNYSDTEIDRDKARFAENASRDIADLEAGLAGSRPSRRAALLPTTGAVGPGLGLAQGIDYYNAADNAASGEALMGLSRILGGLTGQPGTRKAQSRRFGNGLRIWR